MFEELFGFFPLAIAIIALIFARKAMNQVAELRRSLARKIVARQFGLAEDAVEIGHEPTGRPLLVAPHGSGLHLSLATRAGLVSIALAHRPVGVDVERVELVRALQQLPPDQRRAVVLHHLCDMSVRDIAAETGAPIGTVKARLSRGRAALAADVT